MAHPGVINQKFQLLFEPVKDLSTNFNIDLNYYLDEYLNQIETNDVSVRNGSCAINFVEAALILRGSATIYAKKGDYLYDLTLNILESLTGNQKKKISPSLSETWLDEDANLITAEMPALDDIEVSSNILCREEIDENSLSISMPASLQKQKVPNHHVADKNISESKFDRKNFNINNCKIVESTLILNYAEMEPLLSEICFINEGSNFGDQIAEKFNKFPTNGDDSHLKSDCMTFLENDRFRGIEEYTMSESIMPVWSEKNNTKIWEESRRKRSTSKEITARGAIQLLDPYEKEDIEFVVKEKIGKTFEVPQLSAKKKNRMNNDLSIKCFLNIGHFDGARSSKEPMVKKKFGKLEREEMATANDRSAKGPQLAGEGAQNVQEEEDECAMSHCDNFDVLRIPNVKEMPLDVVTSHEEAVQNCLTQFFSSANKYKVTSDLIQKVAEWESKIIPALEIEEKARLYNVHEYSVEFLDLLENCGGAHKPVQFSEIIANKDRVDVCRLFMAALHLANHCNIKILDGSQGANLFCTEIISKNLRYDEFVHYPVPL